MSEIMKTKKITQRNLPLDVTYSIVSTFYSDLENGNCCHNCNKLITNIAEVKSERGTYYVGMDCAETLSGIKENFDFEWIHKARFQEAKTARSRILKAKKQHEKEGRIVQIIAKTDTTTKNCYKEIGAGYLEILILKKDGSMYTRSWNQYPKENWSNYVLPMIKNLITHTENPIHEINK